MSELKVYHCNEWHNEYTEFYLKYDVDAAIDELKAEHHKERHEYIKMIAELKQKLQDQCISCPVKMQEDDVVAELKQELEGAKATAYAESVDSGMENRRLRRELWLARAELCRRLDVDRYLRKHRNSWYNENCLTWDDACVAMEVKICKAESKCRAKAEEYR